MTSRDRTGGTDAADTGAVGPPGLWAEEVGDGPLVVLVHGAMDRSGSMLRVRRALRGTYRVLRYDRRGYGRSLATGPSATFDQQVDDLAALLAGRPAVLAGHSFGGLVCLTLAQRSPDLVRSVLAYEAPMMWERWWPGDSPGLGALASAPRTTGHDAGGGDAEGDADGNAAEWFLRRMIGHDRWERLAPEVRAERRAEGATLVAELRSVRRPFPVPYSPEAVPVPVLAAFGSETRPHQMRAADELARRAPRGTIAVVEGANHGAHLSHPQAFADLVRSAFSLAGRDR